MSEQPPRPGLTRTNTGYPAVPYIGWYLSPKGMREAEEVAAKRVFPSPQPSVASQSSVQTSPKSSRRPPRTAERLGPRKVACECIVCHAPFETIKRSVNQRRTCSKACQGEMQRRTLVAKRLAGGTA